MPLTAPLIETTLKLISISLLLGIATTSRQQSPEARLTATSQKQQIMVNERKAATSLMLGIAMSRHESPEARLTSMWQKQLKLVNELKAATPARQLQVQAEIVALTEERTQLLQTAGEDNCPILMISGVWGTVWVEKERDSNGTIRQYKYGYHLDGESKHQYVQKFLTENVQRLIATPAQMRQ